jgi:hypothetical protein
MVRSHYDKYDDNSNKAVRCRSVAASGISLLGTPRCLERFREATHARHACFQPNGRFAFTRATSVSSTRAALPSRRLRFALFVDNKWRREERDLKTLPRAVILKRFATDLRVLLRAMGFGIRREIQSRSQG